MVMFLFSLNSFGLADFFSSSLDDSVGTSSGLMNANWPCPSVWKVSVVVLPVSQLVCVGGRALYDGLGLGLVN